MLVKNGWPLISGNYVVTFVTLFLLLIVVEMSTYSGCQWCGLAWNVHKINSIRFYEF